MKSIIYNGKKYGKRHVINNILREFESIKGEPKTDFYSDALIFCQELANMSGYSVIEIAGALAALSPLKSWSQNKVLTIDAITGKKVKHTRVQVAKVDKILGSGMDVGEITTTLSGLKTMAFFRNIIGDDTVVTIDRHAVNLALNKLVYNSMSTSVYNFLSGCYKVASSVVSVRPHELQSATWFSWREKNQYRKYV